MKITFKDPKEYKEGDIIIPEKAIEERLDELAAQLDNAYENKQLLLVGLLTGAAWLTVDILERLHTLGKTDTRVTYMKVSSYQTGDTASYDPRVEFDVEINPKNRTILLIDDIADTGKTLAAVTTLLKSKDPASITSLVLVDKPSRRETVFVPEYVGFEIPNVWVQGRGMDSEGFGRGDPNIRKGPYYY